MFSFTSTDLKFGKMFEYIICNILNHGDVRKTHFLKWENGNKNSDLITR